MGELTKDKREVVRDGDQLTLKLYQEQVFSRKNMNGIVAKWRESFKKTTEQLESFDASREEQIQQLSKTFDANKKKYEEMIGMTQEQYLKQVEDIRKKDILNAQAFLDRYNELKTHEIKKLAEFLDNLHQKLIDDQNQMRDTLAFWDKKEYLE